MKTMLTRQVRKTAESICTWLGKEDIAVGGKLPGLNTLSKKFGVSVSTVHTAIKYLANEGIVETEVGSGTFLVKVPEETDGTLPSSSCRTIGLVVWDTYVDCVKDFTPEQRRNAGWGLNIFDGVLLGAEKLNLKVETIVLPSELRSSERKDELIEALRSRADAVDGFVCFPMWYEQKIIDFLVGLKKPWVFINPPDHFLTSNHVTPDYYGGSVVVGQLAARLGAKRIWLVTFTPSWPSCRDRIEGLRNGLIFSNAASTDVRIVVPSYEEEDVSARKAILRQLSAGEAWPDFVYTSGDDFAKGVVDLAREHGLVPGEDISIISSTGLPNLADYDPPISTVQLPMWETGEAAVNMIHHMAQVGIYTVPAKIIPVDLVLRRTTPSQATGILEDIRQEHFAHRQLVPMEM